MSCAPTPQLPVACLVLRAGTPGLNQRFLTHTSTNDAEVSPDIADLGVPYIQVTGSRVDIPRNRSPHLGKSCEQLPDRLLDAGPGSENIAPATLFNPDKFHAPHMHDARRVGFTRNIHNSTGVGKSLADCDYLVSQDRTSSTDSIVYLLVSVCAVFVGRRMALSKVRRLHNQSQLHLASTSAGFGLVRVLVSCNCRCVRQLINWLYQPAIV